MTDNQGTKLVTFRGGSLLLEFAKRADMQGDPGEGRLAKRDLKRYYHALDQALAYVRGTLSEGEASAICDANNGTFWESWSFTMLWANVHDTPGLGEKWGIDQAALIAKMQKWSLIQAMAVVDAVERFWIGCDSESTVFSVGLVGQK
jgi:hypothetical protein